FGVFDRVFFFSSRRRHTRSKRDWSSDVCSSDLSNGLLIFIRLVFFATGLVVVLAADEPARETALGPDAPIKDVPIVVAAYVNQRERLSAFPFVTSRS